MLNFASHDQQQGHRECHEPPPEFVMKRQPQADDARGSKRARDHCHEHAQRLRLPACLRIVNLDKASIFTSCQEIRQHDLQQKSGAHEQHG